MEHYVTGTLDDADGDLWALYENAFQDLRSQAVQRHLMTQAEFKELCLDHRVDKYVVRDEENDRLAALAT